ncbi:MAG: putative integral rane protein [Frankiales bacterium]|nr:putative integral rane protein [Frankiales bacterium]
MIPLLDGTGLDRAAAQRAARDELSRRPYQDAKPPWTYRALNWLFEQIDKALTKATAVVPGGALGLVVVVLLIGGLIALVVWRTRPSGLGRVDGALFGGDASMTAEDHRARAEEAAAGARWADAVRERLRAVARELESRGVLDHRPGRTADELAREAGTAVAAVAAPLRRGVQVFDDVWYGGRTADASSYAVLVEVDRAVRDARLVRA